MHGMVSLGILVAAFAAVTAFAGYLLVRLYLNCPAGRAVQAQAAADGVSPRTPEPVAR